MPNQPSKEAVRSFMVARQLDRTPPPSPERIREMLGAAMHREEKIVRIAEQWDYIVTACVV